MKSTDLIAISPLMAIAALALLVLLATAIRRNRAVAAFLTLAGLVGVGGTIAWSAGVTSTSPQVTHLLSMDGYALFFIGLMTAATFVVALLATSYLAHQDSDGEEFYVVLLVSLLGASVLVASNHFVTFFLGLETLSVGLYVLVAYPRSRMEPLEAGIKYLLLAGASSGFLLLGMAFIYRELGTLALVPIMESGLLTAHGPMLIAGAALVFAGVGFKLAVVPFHMWTPDVYQGAPAPATAFLATVSKAAVLALVLRYVLTYAEVRDGVVDWLNWHNGAFIALALVSMASMVLGNLLALLESSVKRIIAYSSIAHLGYLLAGVLCLGWMAQVPVTFYLVAYMVTILAAFGVVGVLSHGDREADSIEDYRGLLWRRPWLGTVLAVCMLSLAGMPLTAGFLGKFYILGAGAHNASWVLMFALVATSVVGLFYYLRVVVAMVRKPAEGAEPTGTSRPLAGGVALACLLVIIFWLGIYPSPLIHLIQSVHIGMP